MPIGDKFQIGEFKFIILDGRWVPPFEHKEAWDRKGIDGIQTATSGKRGVPFTLRSFRDCEDWEEADQLIEKYRALISEDPVTCILNGVTSDIERRTLSRWTCKTSSPWNTENHQ
jgi:hypothetical protein